MTPSGRGLVQTFNQREQSIKTDRPPTNDNSYDWIIHPYVQLLVIFLTQTSLPLLLKGFLVVCGLKCGAKRKLETADLCLANKEQQSTSGCQLGYATHSDSTASSVKSRLSLRLNLRPSAGSNVRFLNGFCVYTWLWIFMKKTEVYTMCLFTFVCIWKCVLM